MTDQATLQEEIHQLKFRMKALVDETPGNDWSGEDSTNFDAMHEELGQREAHLERLKKSQLFTAPEVPSGVEVIESADPQQRAVDGQVIVEPAPANWRELNDMAFRGWAMGNRASDELADACAKMGYDVRRDSYNFTQQRGYDRNGEKIRFPTDPPLCRSGSKRRPRNQGDILALYDAKVEQRQVGIGTPVGGPGSNTVPDEMMRAIEIALLAFGGMRAMSQILQTSTGANLPWPTTNDTNNKGRILAEHAPATDLDIEFQQLNLGAFKYTSDLVRTSFEFLQDTSIDSAGVIGRLLGERIGRITNDHFTFGDNSGNNPRGVLTDSVDSAITFATLGAVTWEELINLKYSVDPAYANADDSAWMFNWKTLGVLRKVKDKNDNPLWGPSLIAGEPDTFDGDPYIVNQSMPDLATASAKPITFGAQSKYIIRDALGIQMLVLRERYAENAQVGWLAFSRHDGKLLDAGTGPIKHANNPAA